MTESQFKYRARVHLAKMLVLFAVSGVVSYLAFQVEDWARYLHAWQSTAVSVVFYLIGTLFGFTCLFFGSGIVGWFRTYKIAKRDLCDPTPQSSLSTEMGIDMEQVHKEMYTVVIGPIPWK